METNNEQPSVKKEEPNQRHHELHIKKWTKRTDQHDATACAVYYKAALRRLRAQEC